MNYKSVTITIAALSISTNSLAHDNQSLEGPFYSFCSDISEEEKANTRTAQLFLSHGVWSSSHIKYYDQETEYKLFYIPDPAHRKKETNKLCSSARIVATPAKWGWVDGIIEGHAAVLIPQPATYKRIERPVTRQVDSYITPINDKASINGTSLYQCYIFTTVMEPQYLLSMPAATQERLVPYKHKDGRTYMPIKERALTDQLAADDCKTEIKTYLFEVQDQSGNVIDHHVSLQDLFSEFPFEEK